jgi:hypothetical protein
MSGARIKSVRLVEGPLGPIAKGQHLAGRGSRLFTNEQALGDANGLKYSAVNTYCF